MDVIFPPKSLTFTKSLEYHFKVTPQNPALCWCSVAITEKHSYWPITGLLAMHFLRLFNATPTILHCKHEGTQLKHNGGNSEKITV